MSPQNCEAFYPMSLRSFFRSCLRRSGYDAVDLRRFDRAMGAELSWPTHERLLGYLLERALETGSNTRPSFLQIGANDGIKDNFTGSVLARSDVDITLVEPDPQCASKLRHDYDGSVNVSILQVALGERDGTADFFYFEPQEERGIQLNVFSSFDRSLLEEKQRVFGLSASISSRQVHCANLGSIKARSGARKWDLIVSDIEGYDHEVVRQVCELSSAQLPRLLVFEHSWLPPQTRRSCYTSLNRCGYAIVAGAHDTICFLA